jgi:hypothetical protein
VGDEQTRTELRGAAWLVAMYVAIGALAVETYARFPGSETYAFSDDAGATGALSRLVTYVNFPFAIAAIAVAVVAVRALASAPARGAAAVAAALCLVAALPGVVDPDDLRARWVNAPAVAGVAGAVALLALALARRGPLPGRGSRAGDRARLLLGAVLVVWAIPWLTAAAGVHVGDLPGLGAAFRGEEPTPGRPGLASVHLGLHEGLFGTQLALTALVLSRALGAFAGRARVAFAVFLGVMLAYGVAVALDDGWNEQLIKRGWTDVEMPHVLTPALSLGWLAVLAAGGLAAWLWLGRPALRSPRRRAARAARPG